MSQEGSEINISCQPVPPWEIKVWLTHMLWKWPRKKSILPENSLSMFKTEPDMNKEYDFQNEIVWLPFQFNMVDTTFSKQQDQLINLVYNNQQIFSLHDDELGYYDKCAHTIPTTMDKHVYLPQCMIPHQLQGKGHKWLDICLE